MTDVQLLLRGALFAAEGHKKQRRKDAERTPYVNHPIGVANLISEAGVQDVDILLAALFHDLVEDTCVTLDDIRSNFGDEVANIVSEVTDDRSLPKVERKMRQAEHAYNVSNGARLVKLADKIYNVGDLLANPIASWSAHQIQGYVSWSRLVVQGLRSGWEFGSGQKKDVAFEKLLLQFDVLLQNGSFVISSTGERWPALPADPLSFVDHYYDSLK